MPKLRAAIALTAALALAVLPACGDDEDADTTTAATAAATAAAPETAIASTPEVSDVTLSMQDPATMVDTGTPDETGAPEEATTGDVMSVTMPEDDTSGETTAAEDDTGGGDTGAEGPDEAEVRAAIQSYIDAFVAQDGDAACDLLTPTVQDAFLEAVKAALPDASTCEEAFAAAAGQAGDSGTELIKAAEIGPVTVDGDTATSSLQVLGTEQEIKLERVDGEWKIANLPGQ